MKYLVSLDLSKNSIESLKVLASDAFPYLETINLSSNKIKKLPLIRLPALRTL